MRGINASRVVVGGLVAGVVLNVGEYVLHGVILMEEWEAAMAAIGKDPASGSAIAMFILIGFAVALLAVWLYAAVRPRFGPGPKTAVITGLFVWVFWALVPFLYNSVVEIYPGSLMMTGLVWTLVEVPLATAVGAWFYREDGAPEFESPAAA